MKSVDHWSTIILEGYCARTWSLKKDKWVYAPKNLTITPLEFIKKKNPHYDPKYKIPKKPKRCPNSPSYLCLSMECPHFTYTDADEKDYKIFYKNWKKSNQ